MWLTAWLMVLIFPCIFSQNVKIGVVSGPTSDRRQNSEKFWSFGKNYSSSVTLEPLVFEVPYWSTLEVGKAVCAAALKGARALVMDAPPRLAPLISSYSDGLGLPLVTANTAGPPSGRIHLTILPDTTKAAVDFIQYLRWESFAFIYDTDTGADQIQRISQLLPSPPRVNAFWRAYNAEEAASFALTLPPDENRLILATSEPLADDLFSRLAISNQNFHGFLLTPVGVVRRSSANRGGSKLNKISVVNDPSEFLRDFVNRWKTLDDRGRRSNEKELPDSALFLHDISRTLHGIFGHVGMDNPDLLQSRISNNISCFSYTDGFPETVDPFPRNKILSRGITGDIQFDEEGRRSGYTLNIFESTPYEMRKVGKWSETDGLLISEQMLRENPPPRTSPQISGPFLRVTSILNEPFLKLNSHGDYEGYVPDFLDEMAKVTGHRYKLQVVKDGKYGYVKNGTWFGMIGELVNNEADLIVADLTRTPDRAEVIDFSVNFMTFGLSFLYYKPEVDKGSNRLEPFSFLKVWSAEMWAVVVLGTVIFAALCYGASRFIGAPDRIRAVESKSKDNLSPCGSCWFTVGALFLRDAGVYPRNLTHRIWALLWWVFCFFVIVCYIASLTEALIRTRTYVTTTHSRKTSEELLEDLLQKGYPEIGGLLTGSSTRFFTASNVPGAHRDFGNYLQDHPDVLELTYNAGADRVRASKGAYAFIMESPSSDYRSNKEPCDLVSTPGYLNTRTFAPALRKNSTLKDAIDHGVLTLMETGVLRTLYEKWWHNFTNYCEDPNLDLLPRIYSNSLTLHEVSGVFYVLIICAVISVGAAVIEHYISSKRLSLE